MIVLYLQNKKNSTPYLFVFLFFWDRVGADITVLREREVDYDSDVPRKIAEVLIRKVPDDQQVSRATVEAFFFLVVVLLFLIRSFVLITAHSLCFSCSSWTCG